jgi:tetratricopeptide (TPR) repeat protein
VNNALARKPADDLALQSMRLILLSRLGKSGDAREQLAALQPRLTPERFTLSEAWLLFQEGKTAEATNRLRTHLQDPNAAYYWAELTLAEGQSDGVMEALDRHPYDAARWGRLGEFASMKGVKTVAAECFRRALRHDPENAQLLNNFAYASLLTDSFNEAEVLAAAKKVHTMMPGNPSIVHTYASVLLRCRKERECLDLLDKSPALTQKTARLLYAKGQAHERLEQWDPALKAYSECVALPETEKATGELARPALQQRIDHVRARAQRR